MSMLSAQIDKLLTMAAMLVIKDMPEVAAVVRGAADTIWQLRDDLQRANADNTKLRELCADLHKLTDESYVPFAAANKWMDELADIERRMRELGIEVPE